MNRITCIILRSLLSTVAFVTHAAFAHQSMVVTSQHLATEAGKEILDQGGNAVDAAVAVGYALSVVEPCCGNVGGGGFMLVRLKNQQSIVINFREKAPALANQTLYLDPNKQLTVDKIQSGYLAVAVPGTVMGLNTALEKYGTLSLKQVIAPAIRLARQGFILSPQEVNTLAKNWSQLKRHANINSIFAKNGKMLQVGERLIQKDLAHTLEQIETGGTAAFYNGSIADTIVMDSKKQGGVLTKQDFLDYTVEIQKPITCHYRGYEVISAPPPSSGGVLLCEMLNITSFYPLSTLGYHSPKGTHYILEAMRYAYRDRNQLGDPNFVKNPTAQLLSKQYAKNIRDHIDPFKAGNALSTQNTNHNVLEKPQTTHYSVVDREGNAVAVTYTLNGDFGAKIIAGNTGIFLNNEMDDFNLKTGIANEFGLIQGDKNLIQPGKRPLSSMTPTIILKNNALFMILGTPGGSTIPTQVLETIQNVIDYHLDLKAAVNAPRYHMQWLPNLVYMELHAFTQKNLNILEKMGYHFQIGSPFHTPRWGAVAAILFDQESGQLTGAIDERRPAGSVLKGR